MRVSVFLAALTSTLIHASHIRVLIQSTPLLPHPNTLPASTHATLTTLSSVLSSPLRTDSSFDFRNVSSGSYLLDIHCASHIFAPMRVDVLEEGGKDGGDGKEGEVQVWGTFRGNEWANKGEKSEVKEVVGRVGVWGFEGRVLGEKEYFVERGGFSPLSLLKNPMILIAGLSMIIVFGMPYIMDNMDPEMKAEFEERQKGGGLLGGGGGGQPAANPLQNFDAAAWLAGSSTGTSTPKRSEGERVERGVTR